MLSDEKFPLALHEGTVLAGEYIIESVLGQGGFGITYKAKNHKTGQPVAVKEFFPDTLAYRENTKVIPYPGERAENFEYGKESFLQEAQTLAQFIGNENIVKIHSYFEENGTAYFVMDFIEGTSFDDYLKENGGKISVLDAEKILIPIMDALGAVHSKGIVHRDVTPDNIYLCNDGTVKLLDFGAARYSLGDKSRSLDVILKHGFAPKEQYTRRGRQGPYTDIYSLAATFYFAITGKRPPDSVDRLDEDDLIPPSSLGIDITDYQEKALFQALEVQPQNRFQSMAVFKKVLLNENTAQNTIGSTTAVFTQPAEQAAPVIAQPAQSAPIQSAPIQNNDAQTTIAEQSAVPAAQVKKGGKKLALIAVAAIAIIGIGAAVLTPSLLKSDDDDDDDSSSRSKSAAVVYDDSNNGWADTQPSTTTTTAATTTAPPETTTTTTTEDTSSEYHFYDVIGKNPAEAQEILEQITGVSLREFDYDSYDNGAEGYTFYSSRTDSSIPFAGYTFADVTIEFSDYGVYLVSFHMHDSNVSSRNYTLEEVLEPLAAFTTFCDESFGDHETYTSFDDNKGYEDHGWTINLGDRVLDIWACGGTNMWANGENNFIISFTDKDLRKKSGIK